MAQLGPAKTREELTEDAARRAVPHLPGIHELKTAIAARRGMSEDNLQRYDELMDASDAVVDLVRSAKLDAAEVAARDLRLASPTSPTAGTASAWSMRLAVKTRRRPKATAR